MPRPKILLMGDSLTQLSFEGWGVKLANVYQRRADVLNRGYSGYNTAFYLHLLDEIVTEAGLSVCLTIIFFGANDAALQAVDPHHYVPVEVYSNNLHTIVSKVQSTCPASSILLITPPPVHHEQRLAYQRQRYGDKATGVLERTLENTGRYAEACRSVADTSKLGCLDLYTAMQSVDNWADFLNDGLHFSAAGHDFVGDQVLAAIERCFPALEVKQDPVTGQYCNSASVCQALSSNGPYHDEIDHTDIDTAFGKS